MRRRDFLALAGAAAALPRVAFAQQAQTRRLGVILGFPEDDPAAKVRLDAFWTGIAKYGWSEKNALADYRWNVNTADSAAVPCADLVALKPDLLIANGTSPTTALAKLTQSIPIVVASISATTMSGLVQSFAHPGGNITGLINTPDDVSYGKSIDLLKELMPSVAQIAVIFNPDSIPGGEAVFLSTISSLAAKQNLRVVSYPVQNPTDISDAVKSVAADPTQGLLVPGDSYVQANRAVAIGEVAKYRLVAVWRQQSFTADGALISYATDPIPIFRGAGEYAGLVLNGAKPADLPVQNSPLVLTVNLKAAKALGMSIPVSILARADQVIQ